MLHSDKFLCKKAANFFATTRKLTRLNFLKNEKSYYNDNSAKVPLTLKPLTKNILN